MAAPRAAWKGFLRVGAVSCAVKIIGAVTEAEKIRFNIKAPKKKQASKGKSKSKAA